MDFFFVKVRVTLVPLLQELSLAPGGFPSRAARMPVRKRPASRDSAHARPSLCILHLHCLSLSTLQYSVYKVTESFYFIGRKTMNMSKKKAFNLENSTTLIKLSAFNNKQHFHGTMSFAEQFF